MNRQPTFNCHSKTTINPSRVTYCDIVKKLRSMNWLTKAAYRLQYPVICNDK